MHPDPYIDFILMETAMLRVAEEDKAAEEERKRAEWKKRPVGSDS